MNLSSGPLKEGDKRACFVGSGECANPATHWLWTGTNTEIDYACAHHMEEIEAFQEVVRKMDPAMLRKFNDAVDEAHRKRQ